jgi:apolipoprotein N-acyltransferase
MGAEILVFITNDSWFSDSVEAEQHAWQARARAVETGLAAVRVGNSGVTGTITAAGAATWLVGSDNRLLVDRRGTMFDRVFPHVSTTPYVRFGDKPLATAFALLLLAFAVSAVRSRSVTDGCRFRVRFSETCRD